MACGGTRPVRRWMAYFHHLQGIGIALRREDRKQQSRAQRSSTSHEISACGRILSCMGLDKTATQKVYLHILCGKHDCRDYRQVQEVGQVGLVSGAI